MSMVVHMWANGNRRRLSAGQRRAAVEELGLKLPARPQPFGTYVEAVQTGNLLFLSGMLPTEGHGAKFIGRGAVCHSPAVFHRVTYQGAPIVKGKRVTGFTDGEEEAVHLTHVVPFLVDDELKRVGGLYGKAAYWQSFAIVDGRLVTGQNPASSTAAAQALLKLVAGKAA
jgi:hypothetical protein